MRLINADVLKQHIDKLPALPDGNFAGNHSALKALINMQPTVDAVPVKHGRWIYHPDWQADGECGYECSECGMGSDVDYPYCMLCGARMDGKDGEQP